ncbi:MAG TPA: prepilin-type N-terminal cleavage/methylation domain-containing protein, partial [Armatimonadetes bacterium]|nr:prepilin-type N-terminal cleavage/methylation domain-containing protein [Armatimonadota bacterium]
MDITPAHSKGFTLVETLTTVTIAGILVSLATPAFDSVRARNAMASSVNLFLTQLHLARSSAVTRERRITLCPSSNGSDCSDDHQAWQYGYLIFDDTDGNRLHDTNEEIISYQEKAPGSVTIVSSSVYRNRITYLPMGRAWFSNTTVRFCLDGHPELNRAIIVSNNGR